MRCDHGSRGNHGQHHRICRDDIQCIGVQHQGRSGFHFIEQPQHLSQESRGFRGRTQTGTGSDGRIQSLSVHQAPGQVTRYIHAAVHRQHGFRECSVESRFTGSGNMHCQQPGPGAQAGSCGQQGCSRFSATARNKQCMSKIVFIRKRRPFAGKMLLDILRESHHERTFNPGVIRASHAYIQHFPIPCVRIRLGKEERKFGKLERERHVCTDNGSGGIRHTLTGQSGGNIHRINFCIHGVDLVNNPAVTSGNRAGQTGTEQSVNNDGVPVKVG